MHADQTRIARFPFGLLVAAAALWAGPGMEMTAAQPAEFTATIQVTQASNAPMEMTYWVGEGQVRIDMPGTSVIWSSGADARMVMIQHTEQSYMEWGAEQLKMMQQMMGGMAGRSSEPAAEDPSDDMTFEATGARESIGAWDAFEVHVRSGEGDQGQLWLTEDTEVGLFEVMGVFLEMADAMGLPMNMGGQDNAQAMIRRTSRLARAQGLPEGRVVRIVSNDGGEAATTTLASVQPGSAPTGTFDPPAGYKKMEMPMMPRRH